MGEPGTATACAAAASSQEALGYENRGREAKRRETAAMEEKALWWYTSANGKGERQYREPWKGIKRPATRRENRTSAWRRLPIVYARSESPGISRILAAFVPHRDDFIANPVFLPFSIFTENSLSKISLCVYSIRQRSNIYSQRNICFLLLLFSATSRHTHIRFW